MGLLLILHYIWVFYSSRVLHMGFMFILLYIVLITGLFMLPLLPLMMENCAECTYPVPEDISMGLMFAASNILGLGFIFALQVRPVRYVGGSSRQLLIDRRTDREIWGRNSSGGYFAVLYFILILLSLPLCILYILYVALTLSLAIYL